jgi:hypothetical protein
MFLPLIIRDASRGIAPQSHHHPAVIRMGLEADIVPAFVQGLTCLEVSGWRRKLIRTWGFSDSGEAMAVWPSDTVQDLGRDFMCNCAIN